MARQVNPFAFLDDEGSEDVMSMASNVESKMAKIHLDDEGPPPLAAKHAARDAAFATGFFDAGRAERGRGGRGGRWRGGGGRGRFGGGEGRGMYGSGYHERGEGEDAGWFPNGGRSGVGGGRGRGYYDDRSYENGGRRKVVDDDGWVEVVRFRGKQGVDLYNNGYRSRGGEGDDVGHDGWARSGGRGGGDGRGRGRGYHYERGYANGFRQQDGGADRLEEVGELHGERVAGNGSYEYGDGTNGGESGYRGGYGGGRRGFRSGDGWQGSGGGGRFGRGGRWLEAERKDAVSGVNEETKDEIDSTGSLGRKESIATEVPVESNKEQTEVPHQEVAEHIPVIKEVVKVNKEMTLDQYERLLSERRKALEVVKTAGRHVDENEFSGMQIVNKKKDNGLDLKINFDSERPKTKDAVAKDEKSRKVVSINEFLRPRKGERYYGPPSYARQRHMERMANSRTGPEEASLADGHQEGEPGCVKCGEEQFSQNSNNDAESHVEIQLTDPGQFPGLH